MTTSTMSPFRTILIVSACVLGLVVTTGWADAQTCTTAEREAFAALIESSDPSDDSVQQQIEDQFGHCRQNAQTPEALRMNLAPSPDALKVVTNTGNVFFEQLNSCGYHPQAEMISCDVEVRQTTGYGGTPPNGTLEEGIFCLDCNLDGIFEYSTNGFVRVTDDISGVPPSYFFQIHATTFDAPALCTVNDGLTINARAILSWVQRPTGCNFQPIWGNQIDFTARKDP